VRYYGAGTLAALNSMSLPKYATGGQLGGSVVNRLQIPSPSAAAQRSALAQTEGLTLDFAELGKYKVQAPAGTQRELAQAFKLAKLRFGN